jgi:hypothetical protein
MYGDIINREYGKAKQKEYLDEAEARRLIKAAKAIRADREPNMEAVEPELAANKGGFLGLIQWLFQARGNAGAH